MKIHDAVSLKCFNKIYKEFSEKVSLPLIMVNLTGQVIYSENYDQFSSKTNQLPGLISNLRKWRIQAVEESLKLGDVYYSLNPIGLLCFSVPVIYNKQVLGAFISGYSIVPEIKNDFKRILIDSLKVMKIDTGKLDFTGIKIKTITKRNIRRYGKILYHLIIKNKLCDKEIMKHRKEIYVQQFTIANFMDSIRNQSKDISRIIIEKQDDVIKNVKLGDYAEAKKILNELLGYIFFESNTNFEIMKVRMMELIIILFRSAIESGINSKELLGLNYSNLTELNKTNNFEELCYTVTKMLENFIDKVSKMKSNRKQIKFKKMQEFINQNFSRRISSLDVASISGLSVSRAIHLFKEEAGLSITDYMKKLRIDFGKYLLLKTEKDIAEIAIEAGFFDQSHFTKNFKNFTNMTPFQYRQSKLYHLVD
jgi:AraC-like DNA-binding protein/ligand-binding sensor protein